MDTEEDTKEDFCGACLAVPLAMAGVGTAASSSNKKNKTIKKIIFWVGIIISVISIVVAIWFLMSCEDCKI